jgi:hypothetical protein
MRKEIENFLEQAKVDIKTYEYSFKSCDFYASFINLSIRRIP